MKGKNKKEMHKMSDGKMMSKKEMQKKSKEMMKKQSKYGTMK